ncbi:MAG: Ca2+-transporting ATPase, partial [Glaciecola sp.]
MPSTQTGLSLLQAAERLESEGRNVLPKPQRPSLLSRSATELREPMALLLIGAATISGVFLGETLDAIAIVIIVLVNAVMALVQQGRAERALEALEDLDAPTANVIRSGKRRVIDAADLVRGDLLLLGAGDRVPADADVSQADGLEVDEAILTGESLSVTKSRDGPRGTHVALGDRTGCLHRGTLVVRGSGAGVVTGTGANTTIGSIATHLHATRREPTPLQVQLSDLTGKLGVAAVALALGVFLLTLATGGPSSLDEAFLTAVALAVAAVPEGLATVTTVALALGVGRMAQRGAIIRRLPAVETLGATDVLVIDKTGTVTENRMRMARVITADTVRHDPDALPEWVHDAIEPVLVLCNDATLDPATGDPTEQALLGLSSPERVDALRERSPRLGQEAFTSARRRMATVHALDDELVVLIKGAPETLLGLCTHSMSRQGTEPLTDDDRHLLLTCVDDEARAGQRLVALAIRSLATLPDDVETVEQDLTLLAIVTLRDPPRQSAPASVQAVRDAGITLLMATGDHPATAGSIAQEVGIATGGQLTGIELHERGLPEDPTDITVYARVEPAQKLDLVTRLQSLGHTVAMTGDGVNDAPALRQADIGVALGATGSDVAREAADMVITDDDLATIIAAVGEGRGIHANLLKVVDYLVSSNLSEIFS